MNDIAPISQQSAAPFDGKNITPFDELTDEIQSLYDEAKNWADGSAIETQAQCDALDVLDKALLDRSKKLDALRVAEKQPLDEQIDAIQARFNPFIQPKKGKVDMARAALNPIRAAFKERERQRLAAIAEQARREAEEVQQRAQEAMRASSGNLAAREAAERVLADARIAEADAKRTAKAATIGIGLRTSHKPVLIDAAKAAEHYWSARGPDFREMLLEFAAQDVHRGIRSIPGFDIVEEKTAV